MRKLIHIGIVSILSLSALSFTANSFAGECERYERKYEQARSAAIEKQKWYKGAKWQYEQQGTANWKKRTKDRWEEFSDLRDKMWRYEDLVDKNC